MILYIENLNNTHTQTTRPDKFVRQSKRIQKQYTKISCISARWPEEPSRCWKAGEVLRREIRPYFHLSLCHKKEGQRRGFPERRWPLPPTPWHTHTHTGPFLSGEARQFLHPAPQSWSICTLPSLGRYVHYEKLLSQTFVWKQLKWFKSTVPFTMYV